jgi:predicted DNA-binding transcriptional regulator YafY
MSRSARTHDTLVYRLSQVLTKLNMGESLNPQALAEEFGVNLRTIQRDLNVRFGCLPLVKADGRYRLEDAHLGKLTIKDIEHFAILSGVRGLFPQLTDQFLRRVVDSGKASAWTVNGHSYEDLRGKEAMFDELERSIVERRHVRFDYTNSQGEQKFHALVEPYKLVNHKGIWYLAAWADCKVKSFAVGRMESLLAEQTSFKSRPEVEKQLASSDSIWLGAPRQKVLLHVNSQVAGYFKRRKLLPNQQIEREIDGGDILVATTVAYADELLPIVRYWIPYVRVVEPVDFQRQLEDGLATYLGRSESQQ